MSLQLQHLETLLSLPCIIINDETPLTSIPLIQQSREVCEFVYDIDVLPGEDIKKFLERIYEGKDKFEMDCSIYAQLCAKVLSGEWPKGNSLIFYICKDDGAYCMKSTLIPQMGYFHPEDKNVSMMLSGMPTSSKGQWLIKINDSNYLGLCSDGPMFMNILKWYEKLQLGLSNFINNSKDFYTKSYLKVLYELGELDSWVITGFRLVEYDHEPFVIETVKNGFNGHSFWITVDKNKFCFAPFSIVPPPDDKINLSHFARASNVYGNMYVYDGGMSISIFDEPTVPKILLLTN